MSARSLILRPVTLDDEAAFVEAHAIMKADGFDFGHRPPGDVPWPSYVERLDAQRHAIAPIDGGVPSTFLLAEVAGQIVGRVSVRHQLNEWLARYAGHIGYSVLPAHRRRGYASEMLRQALVVARAAGVRDVLITCDDTNVGSATVIERGGGVFESIVEGEGAPKRRYWIGV